MASETTNALSPVRGLDPAVSLLGVAIDERRE